MNSLFHYFNIVALAFSFFSLIIVFAKGAKKIPMVYLFISNTALILTSILYYLFSTNLILDYPHYIRVPAPFLYIIGPSMYLFVRSLLYREKNFLKKDWIHFVPFILHIIELMPFYFNDVEVKLNIIQQTNIDFANHIANFNEGIFSKEFHYSMKAISWLVYFYFSVKLYLDFRNKIRTDIISDYKRIFYFIRFFLVTRFLGFLLLNTTTLFISNNQFYTIVLVAGNICSLVNVFLLVFEFPEMIYGREFYKVSENNREQLMNIVLSQNENLKLLENSKFEGNILIDVNFKILYFNKLAELKFEELYNKKLELNEDFSSYLDLASKENFMYYFEHCIQGRTIQVEEKFMLYDNSDFTWLLMSFTAHHDKDGKLIGVSISATEMDAKKKMEQLQEKYVKNLDQLAWSGSHTLRAPVANMLGIIQLFNETDIALNDSEKKMFLKYLSNEVEILDAVINKMVCNARKELEY